MRYGLVCCLAVAATITPSLRAGLHLSLEQYADLPAQWSGFLLDHRALRLIATPPGPSGEAGPLRAKYERETRRLEEKSRTATLTADERAELGALYQRLGSADRAVDHLRAAQREHPNHFAIAANLGAAYHAQGNLVAAAESLQNAVRLAPGRWLALEELHLKLVRGRLKQTNPGRVLDDLFSVRYVPTGTRSPGTIDAEELKKLPARAAAHVQQLALWFPGDGPLLWQLAELANAHGDVRSAAAMLEGCVVQFGMTDPAPRRRRQWLKEAADALPRQALGDRAAHPAGHAGTLAFRSRKPLVANLGDLPLPPISATGINQIPWEVFTATPFEGKFPPPFPSYLEELKGKLVSITGFMQPLRDDSELTAFLLVQHPIGCWYCEMPELVAMIYVELPPGEGTAYRRGLLRVTGRLSLNVNDPEDFLFTVRAARVGPVD